MIVLIVSIGCVLELGDESLLVQLVHTRQLAGLPPRGLGGRRLGDARASLQFLEEFHDYAC